MGGVATRVQRVGEFNFGTDRVRVLEKTSGSGSGSVWVLALHFYQSGIENLDRVFFGYFPDKVFSFGLTKVLAAF